MVQTRTTRGLLLAAITCAAACESSPQLADAASAGSVGMQGEPRDAATAVVSPTPTPAQAAADGSWEASAPVTAAPAAAALDAAALDATLAVPHDAATTTSMGDASALSPPTNDASLPNALGLDGRQTLVPAASWACGMPEGIPGPLTGQSAFVIEFEVNQERDVGNTPFGRRRQLDVRGGSVSGAKMSGSVLPGGLEYELTLDNGVVELEQIHVLKLGDALVFMRNCGVSPGAGTPGRIVLGMEAAKDGAYAFLNEGRYVATRSYDAARKRLRLEVSQTTSAIDASNAVRISKPSGRPSQSWECKKGPTGQGAEVYQAAVAVSTEWWTVGDSKYGTRNIIPIVGGTMSGKLKGRVLAGGADYQIIVGDFALDARYALQTEDNELIIVRNCGALGTLVPTFETRSDGPYAWLNQGAYFSADPLPSLDLSQIFLTIYEAR